MKKFFKFVPVALGLMAMASCSNDEFASESSAALQSVKQGDLVVESEALEMDGGEGTRSYLSRDMKVRMYVTSDEIKAFDDELNKYDIYAFSWNDPNAQTDGVFRRHNTASNLDGEPRWALYPSLDEEDQQGKWSYNKMTNNTEVTLTSRLQATYEPDGTYQKSDTKFENPLFKDVLPRWGQVTATEGGSALNTSLKYLTGVLRLQLNGAPDYAKKVVIKVKSGSDYLKINGLFKTTLAINDVMQTAEFKAEKTATASEQKIEVTIPGDPTDLKGIDKKKSVVFIPLPTTSVSVDIEVEYFDAANNSIKTEKFENKTIKRAKVYGHTEAINFAEIGADNVAGVSDAIALQDVAEDEDLVVTAGKCIQALADDNIIYIPNLKCKSITVDLSKGLKSYSSTGDLIVKYKDVDGEGKYKNPVIIKTGSTLEGQIKVQLDETPFTLVQANGKTFSKAVIDANALTLGGTAATTAYTEANFELSGNVKDLTITKDASIDAISKAGLTNVYANENGKVVNQISLSGQATNVTASGTATLGNNVVTGGKIAISEKVTFNNALLKSEGSDITINIAEDADVTMATGATFTAGGSVSINSTSKKLNQPNAIEAGKDVSLAGKSIVTGNIKAGQDFSVSESSSAANVEVGRNATINIGAEGVAVSGTLKYNGAGKLNLYNGYVKEVDANDKAVGLYHGEKAGFTAFATLTSGSKFSAKNTSIWNGQQIGDTYQATYRLEAASDAWTASQLAYQLKTPGSFGLKTDVDLDNKDWAGIVIPTTAPAYDITGNGHTVSNINLVGQFEGNSMRAGFIDRTEKAITVTGLTLNGVKTTIKQLDPSVPQILEGVGGLIGKVSSTAGTATLTLVNVKLAADYFGSLSGIKNKTARYIGGLIGQTNSNTTIYGCTADLTGAMLSGHYSLGGFIGQVGSLTSTPAVNIKTIPEVGDNPETKCAVTGLTQMWVSNLDTSKDNDANQGKTGYYIGSFSTGSAITIEDAADVNPTFTVKGMANINKAFDVKGAYMYKYSAGAQSLIGQSGYTAPVSATINGKTYTSKLSNGGSTPDNILYNVTVTEYQLP